MPVLSYKLAEPCAQCQRDYWCGFSSFQKKPCENIPPGAICYDPTPEEELEALGGMYLPKRYVRNEQRRKIKRKPPISIRFPDEVVEHFKKDGPGWQGRISRVLLDYVRGNGQSGR